MAKHLKEGSFLEISDKADYEIVDSAKHVKENVAKKSKKRRIRKIYKRNIVLSIIYTILTFGIYGIFWQFEIAKETNAIVKDHRFATPCAVVFFSIITLGIYRVYWAYKLGYKHNVFYEKHGLENKDYHILYLVLLLIAYVVPVLDLVCYGIMQSKINYMLPIAEKELGSSIYVKDSSIFNRPILSTILLIIIVQDIPMLILNFLNLFIRDLPGNPSNIKINSGADFIQQAISQQAAQVSNADSPYMIIYSIASIVSVLLILWWFKLRFKHSGYKGVLSFNKFGWACLFALPGLFFVALNVIGMDIKYFKIGIVLFGFIPGFQEEAAFRGLIIPNLLRIYNKSKGIWLALFGSSAIFGLIHASNILVGANAGMTAFQVCYAFGLGMLFAGILIRTGNLWPCILLHGLTDAFGLMNEAALKQGAIQVQEFTLSWDIWPTVILTLIFILYGIWLCRPKKHGEICKLWSDKFGNAVLS